MSKWTFWKNGTLVRNEEKCIQCGLCSKRCPHLVRLADKDGQWRMQGICVRCGHCVKHCPAGALKIEK